MPLSTLLSQALVAFTIEFDNEFERQMPHRTTRQGAAPGASRKPWLLSMVMWLRFMRFIPDEGIAFLELQKALGLAPKTTVGWLTRLGKWWGYVTIDADGTVRPSSGGCQARAIWQPLATVIEERWEERFGGDTVGHLRGALRAAVEQMDPALPDSMPILRYGMFTQAPERPRAAASRERLSLSGMLAKALVAFAIEFERDSAVSLAIAANVLRVTDREGMRVRDLQPLAGVSKEAIAMCVSFLEKRGLGMVERSASDHVPTLFLTAKGRAARDRYLESAWRIEAGWHARFGNGAVSGLRTSRGVSG